MRLQDSSSSTFNPHGIARAKSLAGAPLTAFGPRLGVCAIDRLLRIHTGAPLQTAQRCPVPALNQKKPNTQVNFNSHEMGDVV